MTDQTNGADAPEDEDTKPLRDEIIALLDELSAESVADTFAHHVGEEHRPSVNSVRASAIMHLLNERGHYLPGCPPAAQIMADAQQFAGQFMLALLCVRLLRMLNTRIVTQETKGMERWLHDYIDGRNHGPVGKPMLWPRGLPGLASQLRQWGYQPTETRPQFVGWVKQTPHLIN